MEEWIIPKKRPKRRRPDTVSFLSKTLLPMSFTVLLFVTDRLLIDFCLNTHLFENHNFERFL